jgi:hypothetical protein
MKIDNNILEEFYQKYIALQANRDGKTCPPSRAIADSFDPSTSIRKKKKIVDHITRCVLCKEEYLLYLRLQESDPLSNDHSIGPILKGIKSDNSGAIISHRRLLWRYAYFLFGIGLLVSSVFLMMQEKVRFDNQRSMESLILLVYPKNTHIYQSPLIFRWQRQPSSQHYILELFDETLLPIWTSGKINDVRVQLPPEILYKLNIDKSYYWMITGFYDSIKKGESKLASFVIVRK